MHVVAERNVRGRTAQSVLLHTNLPVTTGATSVADLVRGHWRGSSGFENSLYWVLGDTFQEDRCLRVGHATRNMAALRRFVLNSLFVLKRYFWPKMSMRRSRKMVASNLPNWNQSWPYNDFVNALGPAGSTFRGHHHHADSD